MTNLGLACQHSSSPQHVNLLNTCFSSRPVVQISWLFDGSDGVCMCVMVYVCDGVCVFGGVLTDSRSNSSLETVQSIT